MNQIAPRLFVVAGLFAVTLAGCSEEPTTPPAPQPAPQVSTGTGTGSAAAGATDTTTVKTMDEHRESAAKAITPENVESELNKLEKEIVADQ